MGDELEAALPLTFLRSRLESALAAAVERALESGGSSRLSLVGALARVPGAKELLFGSGAAGDSEDDAPEPARGPAALSDDDDAPPVDDDDDDDTPRREEARPVGQTDPRLPEGADQEAVSDLD